MVNVKLVDFPQAHVIVAENQPEYLPMPAYVYDDTQVLTCCWQLTWKERFQLLLTGRVWHSVWTFGGALQPQRLDVLQPEMPMDEARKFQRAEHRTLILRNKRG